LVRVSLLNSSCLAQESRLSSWADTVALEFDVAERNPVSLPPRAAQILAACVMVGLLAGCASPSAIGTASPLHSVPPEEALAFPDPGGPAIVSVTEQGYANAVEQHIYLTTDAATPGQNVLQVQFLGTPERGSGGQSSLRPGYLGDGNVGADMRAALPGVPLQRSPYFVQNRYGPFGYAFGSARSGDRCIFAWQTVRAAGERRLFSGNQGAARIRLRYCDANAGEARLVGLMNGFTLSRFFRDAVWNPLGDPEPVSADIGRPDHPISPFGDEPQAAEPDPLRRVEAPRRRVVARTAPAPSNAPVSAGPLPTPIGPRVPPPPGAERVATAPPSTTPSAPQISRPPVVNAPVAAAPRVIVPPPPPAQ
jgi:hypothetical protein